MLANHSLVGNNIYCILTDEAKGARLAVQHLIDTGRRSIAHIKGYANSYATIIKEDSYLRTLHQNGIEIRPELIVQSPTDDLAEDTKRAAIYLRRGHDRRSLCR